jgi:integrase
MRAIDVLPQEGRSEDVIFGDRLKLLGIFTNENIPTGFALRVRPGKGGFIRSWIMQYRVHGRMSRYHVAKVGEISDSKALVQAEKLRSEIVLGGDPQGEKKTQREKDKTTFGGTVKDFLDMKSGRPNTLKALKGYLDRKAKPLHSTPIDRITRTDISALVLRAQKSSGAPTAGCLRAALSSLFAWAMMMGTVEANPVIGSYEPPKRAKGDRVLTAATSKERSGRELMAIWNQSGDTDYGKIVKLLILTGARASEIGGMQWSEFDFEAKTWILPADRAKNHTALTLPLTDLMLEIIKSTPKRFGVDYLFGPRKVGFTRWSNAFKVFDSLELRPWRLHDIRRSVATGMADIGIAPHIIETILNHISGHKAGPAGIYNRSLYTEEVAAAMNAWSDHIGGLVGKTEVPRLRQSQIGA